MAPYCPERRAHGPCVQGSLLAPPTCPAWWPSLRRCLGLHHTQPTTCTMTIRSPRVHASAGARMGGQEGWCGSGQQVSLRHPPVWSRMTRLAGTAASYLPHSRRLTLRPGGVWGPWGTSQARLERCWRPSGTQWPGVRTPIEGRAYLTHLNKSWTKLHKAHRRCLEAEL